MATILPPPDFKEFLKLLNSEKIDYLVVGGYAVGHYGHVRATADIDVNVISLGDLRANKRASGRPKDLSDLAGLG